MTFTYQGKGALGESREGSLQAGSRSEALRLLARDKIQPLRLVLRDDVSGSAVSSAPATKIERPASGTVRLSQAQIILFTDELGELLHSGLQLEPALQLIERREDKSPVKTVAALARQKVRDGVSFSDALRTICPDFGELYCNLVSAGEVSGALTPLLRRQASHLVAMQDLRSKIQLALIYPACLIGFGALAIVVLMTVLVPQMTSLLAKTGTAVPLPTYILIHGAHFMQHYAFVSAAVLVALFVMFRAYIAKPERRVWWDKTKLGIPLTGPLLSASFYTEFCQGTANLLHHGLPLLSALKLMSRATSNTFYRSLVLKMSGLMAEGSSLTGAMKSVGHFPAALRDLVKIGEQTGELGGTMEKIGQRYEKLMQGRIDRVMAIVPVLVISGLGVVVGLVGWSIMSGIFQAIHGLQGHH